MGWKTGFYVWESGIFDWEIVAYKTPKNNIFSKSRKNLDSTDVTPSF